MLGDNTPLPALLQADLSCKLESYNGFDDAISVLFILHKIPSCENTQIINHVC